MQIPRPNLVFFIPDQWRGDVLGHLGNPAARTPCLDQLVNGEAVSFRNAFCQNPVCTPSRCSFLTGRYPHVAGHRTMFHMLHPENGDPCLLSILRGLGYEVWWGGKNDFFPADRNPVASGVCSLRHRPGSDPAARSASYHPNLHTTFDWRQPPGEAGYYSLFAGRLGDSSSTDFLDPDWCTLHAAIDFLKRRDSTLPFCLFIALDYPHPPYGVEEPYFSAIDRSRLPPRIAVPAGVAPIAYRILGERQNLLSWTESQWRELRATYYGMCMRVDAQLGLLIDTLKRQSVYDDTALFFFSDHGDFTGDYGLVEKAQNLFPDCLTRVPLVIKPPAGTPVEPRISEALVELLDIPATVFDLLGVDPGYSHFGKSLLPLLRGGLDRHRHAVFCEGGRRPGETHCMEGRFADPASLYWPRASLQQSDFPFAHGKAVMCRNESFKFVYRPYETSEFYDLQKDPQERFNRIGDSACQTAIAEMKDRILRWQVETADAVPKIQDPRGMEGPVTAPPSEPDR